MNLYDITSKWKRKEKAVMQTKCIYSECVATSADTKIITPSSEYQLSFREVLNTEPDSAITLCDRHYQLVYREVHMHKVCAGCGAKPKARQSAYTRHSPDAESVCQYLNEHTEFSFVVNTRRYLVQVMLWLALGDSPKHGEAANATTGPRVGH